MKMKFRILALFLAVVMSLSLFACAETPEETTTQPVEQTTTEKVTSEATEKAPETEPAESDEIVETTETAAATEAPTTETESATTAAESVTTETETETATETETVAVETTEYEETFPELPDNYYNSSLAMSIDEIKAQLVLTDYDFDLAEWMLQRFLNAALGLEEPEMPKVETESETVQETAQETEEGTVTVAAEAIRNEAEGEATPDIDYVEELYQDFEDKFNEIDTQFSLLTILYYYNMADTEVSDFYLSAYGRYGDLYNAYIEACKTAYTDSPISAELFADWTEEDIESLFGYDPNTQKLREEVESLQVELNDLPNDKDYNDRSAEIYAQIVTKNNELAKIFGYDNYYEYASKEIYGRDYGVEELENFSNYIAEYFMGSIDELYDNYAAASKALSSTANSEYYKFMNHAFDSQPKNYLDLYIKSYKTGSTRAGFHDLFVNNNFIISKKIKSHPSAFQTYISGEGWDTPICFFGSKGQTSMTIVHEMGHYYAALHNKNVNSYDLAETQSQANEMLFLAFLENYMTRVVFNTVEAYTMYNYVAMTVVCVIIDEFEREVYALESVEGYGSKEFDAIMASVCEKYGGISLVNGNITNVNNYWRQVATNNPVYYISYATSMIAALNIYSVANEDQQAARDIYHDLCEKTTEYDTLLTASAKAGLSNIFEEQTIKEIIEVVLGN